jgi:hypothetical protein
MFKAKASHLFRIYILGKRCSSNPSNRLRKIFGFSPTATVVDPQVQTTDQYQREFTGNEQGDFKKNYHRRFSA